MKPKHWVVFALLGAVWSSSFLWIKIGIQEISPALLVALRMLLGAVTAAAIAAYSRVSWPRDGKTWRAFAILGPTSLAIPIFLISWGEQSIDSAVASILNATVPLFTLVIAHFSLHDDRMTGPKVFGLLSGFAGVVVLLSEGLMAASRASLLGQLAVVLASAFYAGSSVYARKATQHVGGWIRGAAPLLTASAAMWLAVPVVERPIHWPVLPLTWVALVWLGVFGSGLAMIGFYYLIHEIGPTRTSTVSYLFPLGGVILGVVFLGEHLSWQLVVGAALIISGIVVVNRPAGAGQRSNGTVPEEARRGVLGSRADSPSTRLR